MVENAPAPAPSPTPAATPPGPAASPQVAPARAVQSPVQDLAMLTSDPDFVADFSGDNGRVSQQAAVAKKSALTRQAHGGGTEETAAPLPTQIQEALNSPDSTVRAAAEAMVPGETVADYSFAWSDASTIGIEDLTNMNSVAAEAAHAIGANPQYAQSTVAFIEAQLAANTSGEQLTPAQRDTALAEKFGTDGQAVYQSAAALIAQMPDAGREWITAALRGLDASAAVVVIERLARTASANAPKA